MHFLKNKLKLNRKYMPYFKAVFIAVYAAVFCFVSFSSATVFLDGAVDDYFLQRGGEKSGKICIIGVTDDDVIAMGKSAPEIASMIAKRLNESSHAPDVIGYDIPVNTWTEKSAELLREAGELKSNLVIPVELSIKDDTFLDMNRGKTDRIEAESVIMPLSGLEEYGELSHVVKVEDADGILRQTVMSIDYGGQEYNSMAWVCYRKYCLINDIEIEQPDLSSQNSALIKFTGNEVEGCDYTASMILSGNYRPADTENIVFIGYFDTGLDIGYITSVDYSCRMHLAEIEANITEGLLAENLALRLPVQIEIVILVSAIILLAYSVMKVSLLGGICLCVVYELATQIVGMLMYGVGYVGTMLPHIVNAPLTCIIFGFFAYSMRVRQNNLEIEHILGQYVDINIAKDIIRDGISKSDAMHMDLQNVKNKKIAVLFADIRNFTSISEKLHADELVEILNEYLSMMSVCVNKYGGTLDKFIGDCAMGYWGAPGEDIDPVYHACLAASDMQRRSAELSLKYEKKYGIDVAIGIGINYGEAVVGNIGSEDRMNFTAVGDTVNTASRLEAYAPGGKVYLSESAFHMLNGRGDTEKLASPLLFKGKNKAINAYSLNGITVESNTAKPVAKDDSFASFYRRRGYFAAVFNFLVAAVQFIAFVSAIREMGVSHLMYFPVVLSAFSTVIMIGIIPFDIKSIDAGTEISTRPRIFSVLFAGAFTANIETAILYIVNVVSDYGLSAYFHTRWPGGVMIYLVCPVLVAVSFTVFETWSDYKLNDIPVSFAALFILRLVAGHIMSHSVTDANEALYNDFYTFPYALFAILFELAMLTVIFLANPAIRKKKIRRITDYGGLDSIIDRLRNSRLSAFLHKEKNRSLVSLFVNVCVVFFSLRTVICAYRSGSIHIYSNPSLVGIVEVICCLFLMVIDIMCIVNPGKIEKNGWYKSFVFMRTLGCSVNFASMLLVAMTGEGISAFFVTRWNADGWVYLFCPIISFISFLAEKNEYKLYSCLIMVVPFAVLVPLSKLSIMYSGLYDMFWYEFTTFYTTGKMITIIFGECGVVLLLYFANMFFSRLSAIAQRNEGGAFVRVCGSRKGRGYKDGILSEFGNHNSCTVYKDGKYAVVFDCGNGFEDAGRLLTDCTRIDVVITSSEKESLTGLEAVPSLTSHGAEVRIISTPSVISVLYDTIPRFKERFRSYCSKVSPGKIFRLNNSYALVFSSIGAIGSSVSARIFGVKNFVYLRNGAGVPGEGNKFLSNIDFMLYTQDDDWKCACYLAIDNHIPKVIIGGHPAELSDEELSERDRDAGKIVSGISFARETSDYLV